MTHMFDGRSNPKRRSGGTQKRRSPCCPRIQPSFICEVSLKKGVVTGMTVSAPTNSEGNTEQKPENCLLGAASNIMPLSDDGLELWHLASVLPDPGFETFCSHMNGTDRCDTRIGVHTKGFAAISAVCTPQARIV